MFSVTSQGGPHRGLTAAFTRMAKNRPKWVPAIGDEAAMDRMAETGEATLADARP